MGSYIDLIRTAYALELDDEAWVQELARRVGALFRTPAAAYIVWPRRTRRDRVGALAGVGSWKPFTEAAIATNAAASDAEFEAAYRDGPFASLLSEKLPAIALEGHSSYNELMRATLHKLDAADFLGVFGGSAAGGCMLTLPAATPRLAPRTRSALQRVAVHVAAAFRLRVAGSGDPDALLDEQGRLLEGSVDADRTALAHAADALRTASQLERSAPETAVSVWQGLVEGRWSLIRSMDRGGRRHLVLRRNEIEQIEGDSTRARRVASVLALAGRGHPNKLIAYELGIPISTVASDLRAGLDALGMTNRVELVRASAGL